jgi:CRISPR-associated protein Cmr5
MQNLDQIRAAKALASADSTSRQAVSKLPAMILQNGLLAATAFATEDKPARVKMKEAMMATAEHLANPRLGISLLANKTTAAEMMTALSSTQATSMDLQRATTESLAFLAYLKRFTTKEEKE